MLGVKGSSMGVKLDTEPQEGKVTHGEGFSVGSRVGSLSSVGSLCSQPSIGLLFYFASVSK